MEDYQEIKLNKFRDVVVFSFFFISFFSGELFLTGEFCGWKKIKQQKIKYRYTILDEWDYQIKFSKFKYKWIKI